MPNTAAVVVHSADHVRRALDAAAGSPVTLLSIEDGAAVIGADTFAAMVAEGAANALSVHAWLDCADKPGHAMGALRQGCKYISFDGPPETTAKITDIARQLGAQVETRPAAPFDMGLPGNDDDALERYLNKA